MQEINGVRFYFLLLLFDSIISAVSSVEFSFLDTLKQR